MEKSAWGKFTNIVENFVGNKKISKLPQVVDELLQSYKQMSCNMSLKIRFLDLHLEIYFRTISVLSVTSMKNASTGK